MKAERISDVCTFHGEGPYWDPRRKELLLVDMMEGDVLVRHDARPIGKSNYGLTRILALVFSILFSYSLFPLRAAAVAGFAVWRRWPFLVVVGLAAASTALVRWAAG